MKKLLAIVAIAGFIACNDTKNESTTETKDSTATSVDNTVTTPSIADSTRMLDKQLADSNSTMTPDSLK